jgi:hypothetical protein
MRGEKIKREALLKEKKAQMIGFSEKQALKAQTHEL